MTWQEEFDVAVGGMCSEAREWIDTQSTVQEAWESCEYPRWRAWVLTCLGYWKPRIATVHWWYNYDGMQEKFGELSNAEQLDFIPEWPL